MTKEELLKTLPHPIEPCLCGETEWKEHIWNEENIAVRCVGCDYCGPSGPTLMAAAAFWNKKQRERKKDDADLCTGIF